MIIAVCVCTSAAALVYTVLGGGNRGLWVGVLMNLDGSVVPWCFHKVLQIMSTVGRRRFIFEPPNLRTSLFTALLEQQRGLPWAKGGTATFTLSAILLRVFRMSVTWQHSMKSNLILPGRADHDIFFIWFI